MGDEGQAWFTPYSIGPPFGQKKQGYNYIKCIFWDREESSHLKLMESISVSLCMSEIFSTVLAVSCHKGVV